jgi:hypothetical protein
MVEDFFTRGILSYNSIISGRYMIQQKFGLLKLPNEVRRILFKSGVAELANISVVDRRAPGSNLRSDRRYFLALFVCI